MPRKAVFFCGRLGRRVRVSFCGNACRECTRWRAYRDERAPADGVVNPQSVQSVAAKGSDDQIPARSSFQTAFEIFFGVKP